MKNLSALRQIIFLAILAIALIACEGDQGPIGLPGADGQNGAQGPQGPAGPAGPAGQGVENCMDCHGNDQVIAAKTFQYENSVHYLGGTFERGAIASCAGCHSSQGFLDRISTGAITASMGVSEPLPVNCYSCHNIHQTYTEADWALTANDPVTLWINDATVDLNNSNQCLNCHQPRLPSPALPAVGEEGMVDISSTRYGPHHGAQGAMFTGEGGYEIGEGYTNSAHTDFVNNTAGEKGACVYCHMAELIDGRDAGGHTFRVETEGGELNTNGCVACHTDEDELEVLVMETQEEVEGLLADLNDLLVGVGIMQANGRSIPGTYTTVQVGALWNYKYVEEDQSMGVHNAKYARALLENSIASLQ